MNGITAQIYRVIVPKIFRKKILAYNLLRAIQKHYAGLQERPSEEIEVVLDYLKKNPITVFPYSFQDEYIAGDIEVFVDTKKHLRYVLQEGKRLYFKRKWGKRKIQNMYNLLSKEQDIRSPHRYLTEQFTFDDGEVLFDVGAAEGNFALSVVEKASKIYLFEADKRWIEPLKATFEPWKDKVIIVNKFVGNVTNTTNITLDDFITKDHKLTFLKIDVEGGESHLINGCKQILNTQAPLKIALCTYHKQQDEKEFAELLSNYGFRTSPSDGYMLFYYDKKMKAPYFRRGLLRAEKK